MKINYSKIHEKADELEKVPDYLPGIIRMEINEGAYLDRLEKKGLLDKLYDNLNKSRQHHLQESLDEFVQWVNENPEYSDFLVED